MADNKNNNDYNDDSIRSLKGSERVRQRPSVNFGSAEVDGAFHTVHEITGNSLDENRAGFGNTLDVAWGADDSITVKDNGRGVPMGWNEAEQRFNWDLIFNELYAGGKYGDGEADGEGESYYKYSIGLNGLGAASVQAVSSIFEVTSKREGKIFFMRFEHGYPVGEMTVKDNPNPNETGTTIKYIIDDGIFTEKTFNRKMFTTYLEGQAYLNNVTLTFTDGHGIAEGQEPYKVVYEGNGIAGYLKRLVGEEKLIDTLVKTNASKGIEKGKKYNAEIEIIIGITEEIQSKQLHFHNTSPMTLGVHKQAFETAVTDFFKGIGKERGLKIEPYDFNNYISIITSTFANSNVMSFIGQTKNGTTNKFIYDLVYDTVSTALREAQAMGNEGVTGLIANVVNQAEARKLAKEFEQKQKMANKAVGGRKQKAEKLDDCESEILEERECYIVEGDSARGSCKKARDRHTQAIIPVRGKTINALKATLEELLESQIVKDVIMTVGTGIDIGEHKNEKFSTFDMSKRNYDKFIIATDADIDGSQIKVLIYTLFYRLMPEILRQGKLYVAESPLFEIVTNKQTFFAYNITERDDFLNNLQSGETVIEMNRSKGLGQNDKEMLALTTMNQGTRRLIQLKIDIKDQLVQDITQMLFGKDANNERKQFIFDSLKIKLGADMEIAELVDTVQAIFNENTTTEETEEEVTV